MFDALIIAAGEGQRLRDEGIKKSKPLVEIKGIPLIQRLIDNFVQNGASSLNCIVNEKSNDLSEYLTYSRFDIPLHLIVKSTPSSLHSFYELRNFIKEDRFLLTTADSVFLNGEFNSFIKFCAMNNNSDGIIAVTDYVDDERPLYVDVDVEMNILKFADSVSNEKFITGGLYFFKRSVLLQLEKTAKSGTVRLRNYLKSLCENNYNLFAYKFTKIIDVDHISDIEKAEEFLADNSYCMKERK